MSVIRPIVHNDPIVSVVVPTLPKNDHELVIKSLYQQKEECFEVILVNSPELSVCEARNLGLEEANGEIVAFTDDDCQPPADWIANIVEAFKKDSDLVLVEGPVYGGMSYKGYRKYPTCNIAVDRLVALSIGGFDEEFEYWREDTEFGWRMEDHGQFTYSEEIKMFHPDRPRSSIKEENEQRLQQRYPEKYNKIIPPDSFSGRLNDWLWRNGVWETVDKIRYK